MDLTQHWKLLLGLRFDDYQQDIQELLKAPVRIKLALKSALVLVWCMK